MTISLLDVLNSKGTELQKLNTACNGGTFIQLKCHKVQIPTSCKKDWRCVWFQIDDAYEYSHLPYHPFTDEICGEHGECIISDDYRTVRMIFRESPFWFLHDMLGCVIDEITTYNHNCYLMQTVNRVSFCGYGFDESCISYKAESTDKTRRLFADALADGDIRHHVLTDNRCLIEKYQRNSDALVTKTAKEFNLREFYYEHIGEIVELDRLPWKVLELKPSMFVNMIMDKLAKKKRTMHTYDVLMERFA